MWVRTGTFQKETSGAVNAVDKITGLPGKPKAVIFTMVPATSADSTTADAQISIGFSAEDQSGSELTFSDDGGASGSARRGNFISAMYLVDNTGTVIARGLIGFTPNGFDITWAVNDTNAYEIGYMAIGGNGFKAKVIPWNAVAALGVQSVTGVGFQPDAVLHLYTQSGANNAAGSMNSRIALGAMCSDGSQFCSGVTTVNGANPSNTSRAQQDNSCIFAVSAPSTIPQRAVFSSMDSDGFSVNWTDIPGSGNRIWSLCLGGVSAKAITFNKSTTSPPTTQAVTGVGFRPRGIVFSNVGAVANGSVEDHDRLSVGFAARTGSTEHSSLICGTDNVSPVIEKSIFSPGESVVVANNATISYDAQGTVQSYDSDGFTISYPSVNDATATQIAAVCFTSVDEHKLSLQGVGS